MTTGGRECTKCSDERIKEYARKIIEKYTVNFFITGKCRRMTEALEAERQIQKGGKRMNQIQAFNFNSSEIRVVRGADGEPWFVAKDVADVLGYEKPENAVARHCRGSVTTPKQGGGFLTIIPERDVYRLIMRSKLPAAEKFEEWVVGEVLPSIRKHGAYMTPEKIEEAILNPDTIIKLATDLKEERAKRLALSSKAQQDAPKVLFADSVAASHTSILVGELAKLLRQNGIDMGQNRLYDRLRQEGFLMKGGSSQNMPTQRSMDMGLFTIKETVINKPDGSVLVSKTPKVTGKGQVYFINYFLNQESSPVAGD